MIFEKNNENVDYMRNRFLIHLLPQPRQRNLDEERMLILQYASPSPKTPSLP